MLRLTELRDNLQDRLAEAHDMGGLGEVAGLEASLEAAERKLAAMRNLATEHRTVHLGMPDFRHSTGRTSDE